MMSRHLWPNIKHIRASFLVVSQALKFETPATSWAEGESGMYLIFFAEFYCALKSAIAHQSINQICLGEEIEVGIVV